MENTHLLFGLQVYVVILLTLFIIAYVSLFTWVILEGIRRDIGGFVLFMVGLIGSPLIAYAFVKSTRQDSDRVKVEFRTETGAILIRSLTTWIRTKLPTSSIISMTDINQNCRFCQNEFTNNESHCSKCGKKRVGYSLKTKSPQTGIVEYISLNNWKEIKEDFNIKGIKRIAHS